ncbi:hypothetical protein [Shouchella shacheensis]|uniref:hypothetical protein n=1 Tax=Shouchella shacheensis TaxID=1649580 RepID=UPI00073FE87E|nr:hypothetical protein [Shouchella shacheensis]
MITAVAFVLLIASWGLLIFSIINQDSTSAFKVSGIALLSSTVYFGGGMLYAAYNGSQGTAYGVVILSFVIILNGFILLIVASILKAKSGM